VNQEFASDLMMSTGPDKAGLSLQKKNDLLGIQINQAESWMMGLVR
jgi:hypothetical protein